MAEQPAASQDLTAASTEAAGQPADLRQPSKVPRQLQMAEGEVGSDMMQEEREEEQPEMVVPSQAEAATTESMRDCSPRPTTGDWARSAEGAHWEAVQPAASHDFTTAETVAAGQPASLMQPS